MRLRAATFRDIPLLRRWETADHVAAAGVAGWDWEDMLSDDPDWRDCLIAERAGAPLGFVQIVDPAREPTGYWGGRPPHARAVDIWIGEARRLGKGLGTAIMRRTLRRCFADAGVATVVVDPLTANTKAHRFYRRLGFVLVERRRFRDGDCSIFQLTRAAWRDGA